MMKAKLYDVVLYPDAVFMDRGSRFADFQAHSTCDLIDKYFAADVPDVDPLEIDVTTFVDQYRGTMIDEAYRIYFHES